MVAGYVGQFCGHACHGFAQAASDVMLDGIPVCRIVLVQLWLGCLCLAMRYTKTCTNADGGAGLHPVRGQPEKLSGQEPA